MKNISKIILTFVLIATFGCDKDRFADLNTDPATLSEPELRYSLTSEIEAMYNNDYTLWFYNNFQYDFPWSQVTTAPGGNTNDFNLMGSKGGQDLYGDLMRQARDIQYAVDAMEGEQKAYWEVLKAITYPVMIQPYIHRSDYEGSLPYNEAGRAAFTDPPLVTPVYDNLQTLYDTWLKDLDYALVVLSNAEGVVELKEQDLIYEGNYTKWAKFCNLLKLKIAARLVNKDKAKAIQIAEEVANSSVGYMNKLEDDFVYQRGKLWLGTTNSLDPGYAAKRFSEFLVNNRDPRVRFIFRKNDFNPEVIQAFIDAGKKDELPSYILPNINFDSEGNFSGWKDSSGGEPWVRYYGAPVSPSEFGDDEYFQQENLYQLTVDGNTKNYYATAFFNEKLVRTSYGFTYPTKPGGRVIELRYNEPPLKVVLGTSAETLLFLAEFKILGANIPGDAQELLNQAVRLSIERADEIARNNQLPYYEIDPVYINIDDRLSASTKVKAGEVAELLSKDICNLSSGDALEKVYLQQYINYALTPYDVWMTVRRAGIPKRDSPYLAWEPFLPRGGGSEMVIPRRYITDLPLEDDLNYANKMAALEEQKFTPGNNDPNILHSERLWFDTENPDYGEGHKN